MTVRPYEMADDDLARQRRKREERLLARSIPGEPGLTVGDLVADVLAATADGCGNIAGPDVDVRGYLAELGHDWPTIKTVVDYVERRVAPRSWPPRQGPLR